MQQRFLIITAIWLVWTTGFGQIKGIPSTLVALDKHTYENAKPWVVWYFMHASYSKEGIKADLEAMAANNIAGAYFTPIKAKTDPPLFEPTTETLTPEWWEMFRYLVKEAQKYKIQIAMFPNDGFATAGGPWIKPEQSMQKVVAVDTIVNIRKKGKFKLQLPEPQRTAGYYEDIQLFAVPVSKLYHTSRDIVPTVSNSYGEDLQRLAITNNKKPFASNQPGWIQYTFPEPFAANALKIEWNASNYQANRLHILISDDGVNFRELTRLQSPRMGWLDWDNGVTHAIPYTKAKVYRFVYDPSGSEPGAEDLDFAKWKPSLKLLGITLFEEPRVNQYEGKTGEIWRVSLPTDPNWINNEHTIKQKDLRLLAKPSLNNEVELDLPKGIWKILRIGHTSTGHKNETAGAGKGLECDKLDAETVAFQFEQWYGKAKKMVDPTLAKEVLTVFHIDSWECGSQNWTKHMLAEFQKRRGYPLDRFLPVLAGFVVEDVNTSEAFLHDYRETIAELLDQKGFQTLREMCDQYGVQFTAETTAPVMTSDGLSHFRFTDRTMGEFWFRSPSHDKPNDVLDAVSGGHIYGKNVLMSEAFTQIRMQWDEHPRLLKSLQDRNYALGINNLAYHVYVHNPWMDRKPGMTLDGVGTYFQRDQIWWKPGREWVNYAIRTQQLLQHGTPVRDVAIFIGEEIPRRSLLPDRLVHTLPGIIGKERVQRTDSLLRNVGQPLQKIAAVSTSANMYDPLDWIDPLQGYAYDSFNPQALLQHTKVKDGAVVFSDHIAYRLLVVPGKHLLNPIGDAFSLPVLERFAALAEDGACILFQDIPQKQLGYVSRKDTLAFNQVLSKLFGNLKNEQGLRFKTLGKGKIYVGTYEATDFTSFGIEKDILINGGLNTNFAWNHRQFEGGDSYFIANQDSMERVATISLRQKSAYAYAYNAVTDQLMPLSLQTKEGRTLVTLNFDAYQSLFVLLSEQKVSLANWKVSKTLTLQGKWHLQLEGVSHLPIVQEQPDFWTNITVDSLRYHAGTVSYTMSFHQPFSKKGKRAVLRLAEVESMAEVILNGSTVGVIWTKPYALDVTDYIKEGDNSLEIKVYNTWGNRFGYETNNNTTERLVKTTATAKFLKEMQPAGISGEVKLIWYETTYNNDESR
ncbi:glycosyl hydrolase [Sphingobacterium sp. LRF_L2]|uniref:glycosyl hydrolase n=1 Tax=Sphingobacterium sp. LRF_L2 TaxID=3369421 RepID=UPI003F619C3C